LPDDLADYFGGLVGAVAGAGGDDGDHRVRSGDRFAHRGRIPSVTVHDSCGCQRCARLRVGQRVGAAGEGGDLVAAAQALAEDMTAGAAGGAEDRDFHLILSQGIYQQISRRPLVSWSALAERRPPYRLVTARIDLVPPLHPVESARGDVTDQRAHVTELGFPEHRAELRLDPQQPRQPLLFQQLPHGPGLRELSLEALGTLFQERRHVIRRKSGQERQRGLESWVVTSTYAPSGSQKTNRRRAGRFV